MTGTGPPDPYVRLGIAPTASDADIARAYRRQARGAHPDLHPDDPLAATRFAELTAAYDLLRDAGLRAAYDRARARAAGTATSAPDGPGAAAPTVSAGPVRWGHPGPTGGTGATLWAGPASLEEADVPERTDPGSAGPWYRLLGGRRWWA